MGRVVAPPELAMGASLVTGAAAAGAGAGCVVAVAAPPPPTPVVPIGVPCELCWPAPVAALGLAVVGGVPCAMAVPTTATVAKPASNVFSVFDAVMWRLLDDLCVIGNSPATSPAVPRLVVSGARHVSGKPQRVWDRDGPARCGLWVVGLCHRTVHAVHHRAGAAVPGTSYAPKSAAAGWVSGSTYTTAPVPRTRGLSTFS